MIVNMIGNGTFFFETGGGWEKTTGLEIGRSEHA